MKIAAVVITCPGREPLCRGTLDALRATDWPRAWPVIVSRDRLAEGTRQHRQQLNALAGLRACVELGPDFILFLEDDVTFNAHIGHNLVHWQPLQDRALGMGSLYNPTIHQVERVESRHWFKASADAVYGSQAFLFSLEAARYVAEHWHDVEGMQDIKMSRLAARGGWSIYYHVPSLVQHVGRESTWGGGYHRAPDFDAQFRTKHVGELARSGGEHGVRLKHYTEIPGWFDEEWLYDRMIDSAPEPATFVEVGCWLGRSTAYCAQRIRDGGKAIRFYAVDTWQGSPSEPAMIEAVSRAGGSVFGLFCTNMEEAGVIESIHPLRMLSVAAAGLFADGSVDFVFIDADHSRDALEADIAAWRPKIRPGGTLAGHDWNTYGSVQEAVRARLGGDFSVEGNCWIHQR